MNRQLDDFYIDSGSLFYNTRVVRVLYLFVASLPICDDAKYEMRAMFLYMRLLTLVRFQIPSFFLSINWREIKFREFFWPIGDCVASCHLIKIPEVVVFIHVPGWKELWNWNFAGFLSIIMMHKWIGNRKVMQSHIYMRIYIYSTHYLYIACCLKKWQIMCYWQLLWYEPFRSLFS